MSSTIAPRPPAPAAPLLALLIPALGISQVLNWGTLYYSLAVLAAPIQTALGFGPLITFGSFTLGMLLSGLVAPTFGRWIDHRGGRLVMAFGSLLAALSFVLLALASGPITFLLAWLVAGIAMAASLYEAAFATLHQLFPVHYRRAVTVLTLIGGFASTLFWPLTLFLVEQSDWRSTALIFAGLHLLVGLPIHALLLPKREPVSSSPVVKANAVPVTSQRAYRWLLASFVAGTFVFAVFSSFMMVLLQSRGFTATDAVAIAALIGPMQVLGRTVEWSFGRQLSAMNIGKLAAAGLVLALALLLLAPGALAFGIGFALLYGSAAGVMTIVRGTVPLELFGQAQAGTLLGQMARPNFIAKALAPGVFALLLQWQMSPGNGLVMLLCLAAISLFCFLQASKPFATSPASS